MQTGDDSAGAGVREASPEGHPWLAVSDLNHGPGPAMSTACWIPFHDVTISFSFPHFDKSFFPVRHTTRTPSGEKDLLCWLCSNMAITGKHDKTHPFAPTMCSQSGSRAPHGTDGSSGWPGWTTSSRTAANALPTARTRSSTKPEPGRHVSRCLCRQHAGSHLEPQRVVDVLKLQLEAGRDRLG